MTNQVVSHAHGKATIHELAVVFWVSSGREVYGSISGSVVPMQRLGSDLYSTIDDMSLFVNFFPKSECLPLKWVDGREDNTLHLKTSINHVSTFKGSNSKIDSPLLGVVHQTRAKSFMYCDSGLTLSCTKTTARLHFIVMYIALRWWYTNNYKIILICWHNISRCDDDKHLLWHINSWIFKLNAKLLTRIQLLGSKNFGLSYRRNTRN